MTIHSMNSFRLICLLSAFAMLLAVAPPGRASEDRDRENAWREFIERPDRPRIGIALGGGGARGMAHIGVLRAFEKAGIPIDVVSGTSIGSFIGALYATGADLDRIEELALKTQWSNLIELRMSRSGFFSTRRLEQFIGFHLQHLRDDILHLPRRNIGADLLAGGDIQFNDLKRPFVCTATDLYSGSLVRFDTGSVAFAVRASCSIPGLFAPVQHENRTLVDGGVLVNLPVTLARDLGAEIVIAIDLESDTPEQISGLIDILSQIIRIQGRALTSAEAAASDFIVTPAVGAIKTTELSRTQEAVTAGEVAGWAAAAAIKEAILAGRLRSAIRTPAPEPAMAAFFSEIRGALGLRGGFAVRSSHTAMETARLAAAALALGLDREVLRLIALLPERDRGVEERLVEAIALTRLGRGDETTRIVAKLEEFGAPAGAWRRLADAARLARHEALLARAEGLAARRP
jgi:NTE family protein